MNEHIPNIETYIKRLNWYLQEHYPANKKITAEEWNALFLALINQGNTQEDTLEKICNEILPPHITAINYLLDAESDHSIRIKLLEDNKAGNIILDGDTYQDRLNNIYYEKDGFKSEGILFYKANHEAYLRDANLDINRSPVYISGVCFVTGFYQFDSSVNPDIYVQEEILINSNFWSYSDTGVFHREIYLRKSTEHPSGYVGVREEATQQGRYYFTPIMSVSDIGAISKLIKDLDWNKVSQSQLDETNRNIDKKVDKKTTSGKYVYTHIGEVQGEAKLSDGAEDNAVVQRTVGGYVYVPNTYPQDKFPDVAMGSVAVNKAYVDLGVGLIQANLIGEVLPSEEENGYKQVLTFNGLKGEDGTALTLFTTELSLPKTNLEITEDSSLFKYTFTLKDNKGNVLSTKTIDLPLEELVVDGLYNNTTKSIVLTLKNGNTVNIPVGDLVEGLVNSTDLQNALDTKVDKVSGKNLSTNDLTNELVAKINSALQEHQPLDNYATLEQVNAKYTKPSTGIPKTDLDSSVQSSLGKLDGLANIKTIGDNLTLDGQGKLSAKTASGVSSINGQTGAVTDIATTEEVNTAKQSANSYTDTKTGEISTALQQNTTIYTKFDTVTALEGATVSGTSKFLRYGKFYAITETLNITGSWTLGGGYSGWSTPVAIATVSGGDEALTSEERTLLNGRLVAEGSGILAKQAYIENGTIYIRVLQAAGGTNTITRVYLCALDWNIIDYPNLAKYPVGSIYMSTNSTSPAAMYGGTWATINGKFLLGADSNYSVGDTGGESTHTLTIDEMPSHSHEYYRMKSGGTTWWVAGSSGTIFTQEYINTNSAGNGQAHNNMPPYFVVYIWRRTA